MRNRIAIVLAFPVMLLTAAIMSILMLIQQGINWLAEKWWTA